MSWNRNNNRGISKKKLMRRFVKPTFSIELPTFSNESLGMMFLGQYQLERLLEPLDGEKIYGGTLGGGANYNTFQPVGSIRVYDRKDEDGTGELLMEFDTYDYPQKTKS